VKLTSAVSGAEVKTACNCISTVLPRLVSAEEQLYCSLCYLVSLPHTGSSVDKVQPAECRESAVEGVEV
jgi:hypothetical protein